MRRALDPDHEWTLTNHLLAGIFDSGQVRIWQAGQGKKSDYPQQLERPGVKPRRKKYGGTVLSMQDMAKRLGWDTEGGVA